MRIKPWMEVVYANEESKKEELQEYFKYDWYKCKSLKQARRLYKQEHMRWNPVDRDRELLNNLYEWGYPGCKVDDCALGQAIVKGARITLYKNSKRIKNINLIGENGRYSCDFMGGGGCCSRGWVECVYEGEEFKGWIYLLETGPKFVPYEGD